MPGISIDYQERDFAVLLGLFESRLMTARHIAAIYFDGKGEMAKKRLQKLKAAGVVGEKRRRPYEPSILFLTNKALRLLQGEGRLSEYPAVALKGFRRRTVISEITLRHELAVLDVKAAFYEAVKRESNLSIAEFSTWPLLHQFRVKDSHEGMMILVKPDGFMRVHEDTEDGQTSEHTFFLEVDRGSETLATLAQKAVWYNRFYREGGMAERHGRPREEYRDFPFRALFVVKSEQRQKNLARMLLEANPPILSQSWIAVFDETQVDPLTPVWLQPLAIKKQGEHGMVNLTKNRLLE